MTPGEIRLIAHACIEIGLGGGRSLLCDPWFFGRVFNESWELLAPPALEQIDLSRVRYIWISHEHPDHLHFPTLKWLRSHLAEDVEVLFREQRSKNVSRAIAKLGFPVRELKSRLVYDFPGEDFRLVTESTHSDCALAVQVSGKVILNQNDCRLSPRKLATLASRFGPVDVWLFQFSLAGYYGNEDDHDKLSSAGKAHIDLISSCARIVRPRVYVPFASFVSFCHPRNTFLNNWRVRIADLSRAALPEGCTTLVLRHGGLLQITANGEYSSPESTAAEAFWETTFSDMKQQDFVAPPEAEDLGKVGSRFVTGIARQWPGWLVPAAFSIRLDGVELHAVIDCRRGTFKLASETTVPAVAEIDSQSLEYMLRFPWGADTIHISSVARVLDDFRWRWLLYLKHADYKLDGLGFLRYPIPLLLATVRGLLGFTWYRKKTGLGNND